jgi:IclR family pca regulon transcriptional regulator
LRLSICLCIIKFNCIEPSTGIFTIPTFPDGYSRATARRFLLTLNELGYVGIDERYFYLRPKLLELGYSYLSSLSFDDVVQKHLNDLAQELHESASASVLEFPDVVYVARASTNRVMTIGLSVGTKLPALYTSMGRVMLAQLPASQLETYLSQVKLDPLTKYSLTSKVAIMKELKKVAASGWCLLDQELEVGLRSLAVPIGTHINEIYASINVSVPASRVSTDQLKELILPRLLATATQINNEIRKIWPQ